MHRWVSAGSLASYRSEIIHRISIELEFVLLSLVQYKS